MSYRNYYDTSPYSRPRDSGRTTSSVSDRPTAVTAKYVNATPSYKSSSIPVLSNDRSTREDTTISAIANRYASYNKSDKATSKYEKKDFTSKLSVPSSVSINKSRDVSPVSTSSKYSLSRTSRHLSPDHRTATKSLKEKNRDSSPIEREKHIPSKTDKPTSYNSLSSYKLYAKTPSYSRPSSRTETKPEVTVNRYAIANRLSSSYLRNPTSVKRSSLSPVSYSDNSKSESDKPVSTPTIEEEDHSNKNEIKKDKVENGHEIQIDNNDIIETVSVITRHTSPTPPGSSSYVRSRRADMAKTVEKIIIRARKKPEMVDKEIQSDRLDDTTRTSRFGNSSRTSITNWTFYAPSSNSYTGYAGRYSTQYSNLRDNNSASNSYDRSSRSRSTEPISKENALSHSSSDNCKDKSYETDTASMINNERENISNKENISEPYKNEDVSDIIINVNLKLKKAQSPINSTELVSPEIIITNSQLPPHPPKTDTSGKPKKVKVRKTSTESNADGSSKKKVLKKRSKSVSSTDSDQGNEKTDKDNTTDSKSPKSITKTSVSTSKNSSKLKHSKSRESNSPESSITLSTQSSISEDESVSKSKTNDISRTSADETSIPTDRSAKQSSPNSSNKNDGGTEEAKSFLIRALAPVTNLFKLKYQDSSENSCWLENTTSESTGKDISNLITESGSSKNKNGTDNIVASNDDNVVKLKGIRHIESGERAWWLDSESDKRRNSCSGDKIRKLETSIDSANENMPNGNSSEKRPLNKRTYNDDEKPWWLDSSANIPEGIERLTPPRKSSSDSDKSDKFNFFKVRHIESGDKKDWWLTSNENSSNSNKVDNPHSVSLSKSGSDQRSFPLRRIRHVESGERPWWLASDKNIPEGIEKLPTPPPKEDSDSSDSEEIRIYVPSSQIPPFPLHLPDDEPLGDRRSPEGLETPRNTEEFENRRSPYENNRKYSRITRLSSSNQLYQKNLEKYISRYTDIDDILGTSGQIYSPFMDSLLARRTGQISFDDAECEEIDPTQVRIHDSTPQMPVIKKLGCRSEIIDYREEDQLDDATLQVFKDGDYGPYLDLDSTLGEQDEELEGLPDRELKKQRRAGKHCVRTICEEQSITQATCHQCSQN